MACRSHCPVPWHSANLWEPEGVSDVHPAVRLQKAVWRNKLELKPKASRIATLLETEDLQASAQALETTLERSLEDGKVSVQSLIHTHNDQLQQVAAQFRRELAAQQQAFTDQLRGAREEIQKLRSALKQEKSRTRRLQELLRGDI